MLTEYLESLPEFANSLVLKVKFPLAKQIRLITTLSRLLGTLTPTRAIDLMYKNSSGIEEDVLSDFRDCLRDGGRLAHASSKWFDTNIVMSIRFGEDNNALKAALDDCLKSMNVTSTNLFKPFLSVIKPFLYMVTAMSIVATVGSQIVKILESSLKKIKQMPLEMDVVLFVINFFSHYLLLTIALFFIFVIFIWSVLKNYTGENREWLDDYPLFLVYRQLASLNFLKHYSFLRKFKDPDALIFQRISAMSSGAYVKSHIDRMSENIRNGQVLGEAIDSGLIPSADLLTIKVLTENAPEEDILDQIMISCAALQESIIYKFETLATIAGNVFMLLAAGITISFITVVIQLDTYLR